MTASSAVRRISDALTEAEAPLVGFRPNDCGTVVARRACPTPFQPQTDVEPAQQMRIYCMQWVLNSGPSRAATAGLLDVAHEDVAGLSHG